MLILFLLIAFHQNHQDALAEEILFGKLNKGGKVNITKTDSDNALKFLF
jgi:hypothetical protein